MADGMEVVGDTYLYLTGFLGSRQQGREKYKSEGERERERNGRSVGNVVTCRAAAGGGQGAAGGSGWPGPASPEGWEHGQEHGGDRAWREVGGKLLVWEQSREGGIRQQESGRVFAAR